MPYPVTMFIIKTDQFLGRGNCEYYWLIWYYWNALIVFDVENDDALHFDSSGAIYILRGIKKFTTNKNIKVNIFRIQAYHAMICVYICIWFTGFKLNNKTLRRNYGLFFPN